MGRELNAAGEDFCNVHRHFPRLSAILTVDHRTHKAEIKTKKPNEPRQRVYFLRCEGLDTRKAGKAVLDGLGMTRGADPAQYLAGIGVNHRSGNDHAEEVTVFPYAFEFPIDEAHKLFLQSCAKGNAVHQIFNL